MHEPNWDQLNTFNNFKRRQEADEQAQRLEALHVQRLKEEKRARIAVEKQLKAYKDDAKQKKNQEANLKSIRSQLVVVQKQLDALSLQPRTEISDWVNYVLALAALELKLSTLKKRKAYLNELDDLRTYEDIFSVFLQHRVNALSGITDKLPRAFIAEGLRYLNIKMQTLRELEGTYLRLGKELESRNPIESVTTQALADLANQLNRGQDELNRLLSDIKSDIADSLEIPKDYKKHPNPSLMLITFAIGNEEHAKSLGTIAVNSEWQNSFGEALQLLAAPTAIQNAQELHAIHKQILENSIEFHKEKRNVHDKTLAIISRQIRCFMVKDARLAFDDLTNNGAYGNLDYKLVENLLISQERPIALLRDLENSLTEQLELTRASTKRFHKGLKLLPPKHVARFNQITTQTEQIALSINLIDSYAPTVLTNLAGTQFHNSFKEFQLSTTKRLRQSLNVLEGDIELARERNCFKFGAWFVNLIPIFSDDRPDAAVSNLCSSTLDKVAVAIMDCLADL
jgi:hypothetical protein